MEMIIDFPGGAKVDAAFMGFRVQTDQPTLGGGDNTAPTPFQVFLASLGTCAGIFVLGFCRQRGLPTEGIRLIQRIDFNRVSHLLDAVEIEIQVPPSFPQKYHEALVRSADQCLVKRVIENPPKFTVFTKVTEA